MEKTAIGIDIGGSHITCQQFNLGNRQLISGTQVRKPVDCHATSAEILDIWAEAIEETAGNMPSGELTGIGFAMPGPFDYPGGIAWFRNVEKYDNLYGVNIRKEILLHLNLPNGFPVRFLNDAACFAIGESFHGGTAQHGRVLAITLGTGFGTTFIENHLPVAGKYSIPEDGFLYHIPFLNSVADDYFSTRWFINEYESMTGIRVNGVKELAEMSGSDREVAGLFQRFGSGLGSFLAPWLKQFEAGCLVIGGNISSAFHLFSNGLAEEFQKAGLSTEVLVSTLQEDAALAGSAFLCDNEFYDRLLASNG